MELNADQLIEHAIRDGLREGIKSRLTASYNSPIDKWVKAAIGRHAEAMRGLLDDSLKSCLDDAAFREDIAKSVRSVLAKTLVQRFGGELEKQVNVLKSDPTTRARITVAIEDIVRAKVG